MTSVVRIHPPPPRRRKLHIACGGFFVKAAGALIPLRLLSKLQPLRFVAVLFFAAYRRYPFLSARFLAPPLPQKVTLAAAVRL